MKFRVIGTLSNCNIKVALKPYLTLGHIFEKPKDPVKTNQKTHAVYSIPCYTQDCVENSKVITTNNAYLPEEYMHLIGRLRHPLGI